MLNKVILSAAAYFFIVFQVIADSDSSTIDVEIGSDEQGNKNSAISVKLSKNDSKNYLFGVGKSELPSDSETINSNYLYFGISKMVSEDWKVTGMIEYSNLTNEYTMISTSVPVRLTQDSYYIELIPMLRSIRLTSTGNKASNIGSSGLGLKSGIFLGEHFRLSGSAYSYAYSADVSQAGTFGNSRFFTGSTLSLSSDLLKKSYNIETGLDFDSFSVSLGKNKAISESDNSTSESIYTALDYYLSKKWSLSILFGEYLNTPQDQNNYSSLTVGYAF